MTDFASRGDLKSVITLVEAWRSLGEVSVAAELAQARALAQLGQHDRAWVRLRPLLEGPTVAHDTFVTAAQLLVDRGWLKEARALLAKANERFADSTALFALNYAASEDRDPPDLEPRDLDTRDVEAGLAAVGMWFAQGQQLRAATMLDRLARAFPKNEQVALFRWAAEGDYGLTEPLGELLARAAPELSFLSELPVDSEHTESVPAHAVPTESRDATEHSAFKSLFRNLDPHTDTHPGFDDPEVTAVTTLADLQATPPADEATDARGEDTQIMRVVRRDGEVDQPVDKIHDATPDVTESFDLASYRKELGIERDFAPSAEQEDEDVVVVTRVGRGRPDPTVQDTEVQGVRLTHEALAPTSARKLRLENEDWARPAAPDAGARDQAGAARTSDADLAADDPSADGHLADDALTDAAPTPAPRAPRSVGPAWSRAPSWTWWLLTLVLLAAFAVVAALVLLAVLMSS